MRRSDGLEVILGIDGWIIMPGDEGPPIDRCPCCGKALLSPLAAQIVADTMLPIDREWVKR
jgi:hypothetical protein